jgi:hypothetical protein
MPTTPSGDRGTLCRRRARVELLNDPCGFPELRDDRVALVPLDDTLELGVVVTRLHREVNRRAPNCFVFGDRELGRPR